MQLLHKNVFGSEGADLRYVLFRIGTKPLALLTKGLKSFLNIL
jgi:hypothetical protein